MHFCTGIPCHELSNLTFHSACHVFQVRLHNIPQRRTTNRDDLTHVFQKRLHNIPQRLTSNRDDDTHRNRGSDSNNPKHDLDHEIHIIVVEQEGGHERTHRLNPVVVRQRVHRRNFPVAAMAIAFD